MRTKIKAMLGLRIWLMVLGVGTIAGGCAPVARVGMVDGRWEAAVGKPLAAGESNLIAAESVRVSDPDRALDLYLDAARESREKIIRGGFDEDDRETRVFNYANARVIDWMESHDWEVEPGRVRVINEVGPLGEAEVWPTDRAKVTGSYFRGEPARRAGVGAPAVVDWKGMSPAIPAKWSGKAMYSAATGVLTGRRGGGEELRLLDPHSREEVVMSGRRMPLAADFTAPIASVLAFESPQKLAFDRLIRADRYTNASQLIVLEPIVRKKVPLIFVHGLDDSAASWAPMVQGMMADPVIRRRCQVWVFQYPSGLPFPLAAADFREQLKEMYRENRGLPKAILVGHSMGGMVSRMQVIDPGEQMWMTCIGKPRDAIQLPVADRIVLERGLVFESTPHVERVIFISTPHRGADMASGGVGRLGASLVRLPVNLMMMGPRLLAQVADSGGGDPGISRFPNSIDTLRPEARVVKAMVEAPFRRGVRYHSIIGDRGRNDSPNSSDGVVAYWSSHVDGAESELVVPYHHGAHRGEKTIAEVKRIVRSAVQRGE